MLENSSSMDVMRSTVAIRKDQEYLSLPDVSQKPFENKWGLWSSDFECEPILLHEMTRRLVQEFQPEKVILFGSHAWGTPNQDSDIDLMVIVEHSKESDYERMLRGYRCLSGINIPKDVIVKTKAEFDFFRSVRASLEYKIVKEGKVLYERD